MLAVLLALAAAVSFGGSDYLAGRAARQVGVVKVAVTAEVVKAVLVMAVVPFVSSQTPTTSSLTWGAVAGCSGGLGEMALYLGFRYAAFSVASSVSAVGTAAFSVLAGFLLGERPGAFSLAGIVLTLPAIVGVSASIGKASPGTVADSGEADVRGSASRSDRAASGRNAAGIVLGLIVGAGFGLSLTSLNRAGSLPGRRVGRLDCGRRGNVTMGRQRQ